MGILYLITIVAILAICALSISNRNVPTNNAVKIVAVDFDNTLYLGNADVEMAYAYLNFELVQTIEQCQKQCPNYKWILWTCRDGNKLEEIVKFLEVNTHIKWDAINDNVLHIKQEGLNPRKVIADIYIDDCAMPINTALNKLR